LVGSILAPVLVYGTLFGLTYVLLALGFTLLLGISRVLNLAYGALYMVTAYMIFYLAVDLGFNLILATALAIGIAIAAGVAIFLLCVKFAPDPMRFLVVTLLIALLLQYLFSYYFQGQTGLIISGLVPTREILLFGVSVSPVYLVTGGVSLAALFGLWVWIDWTSYGRTVRAAADDPETASLFGIRVRSVYLVVVAVSSALVAIAAALIVPAQEVTPTMWVEPFVIAFVVSVIGGLEKFKWTLPAAFLLSFSQFFVEFEYPTSSSLSDIVAFVVAIGFIIVLPRGIGGIRRDR
jgi:branched-chain amino acid transport system permease protein